MFSFDGTTWIAEAGLPPVEEGAAFAWHPDGGVSLTVEGALAVRAPAEVGSGSWRVVAASATRRILGPGVTVRTVEARDGVVRIIDEAGEVVGTPVEAPPGHYYLMPWGWQLWLMNPMGGGPFEVSPDYRQILVDDR